MSGGICGFMTSDTALPQHHLPAGGRLLLAVAVMFAMLMPWWMARQRATQSFPGFLIPTMTPHEDEAVIFEKTTINPASTLAKAHSATLVEMPDGSLVAAWYAGSGEGAPDVGIYVTGHLPGGVWSEPHLAISRERVMHDLNRHVLALGNPVLVADKDGRLGLLFVSICAGRWSGSSLNITWSPDGGRSWGAVTKLVLNPFVNLSALPRNPPVTLVGGGWAVPIYQEFMGLFPEVLWLQPHDGAFVAAVSRMAGGMSAFQPAIIPLSTRRAVGLLRDAKAERKKMQVMWTEDGGQSWSVPIDAGLPNPNSGVCAVRLADGRLLCAFNDVSPGKRENLRLAVSRDEGRTWQRVATLEEQAGQEFSYPFMIVGKDGRVRMVYSARGTQIRYAEFNLAWIDRQELGIER